MKTAKKRFLYLMVFTFSPLLYVNISYAASLARTTVVNSEFDITNRVIERNTISSMADGFIYSDEGQGVYRMTDNFKDADSDNLVHKTGGNQQWYFNRPNSLFRVKMTGQKLGHVFYVSGKYVNTQLRLDGSHTGGVDGGFSIGFKNKGCQSVLPNTIPIGQGATSFVEYSIQANTNMETDCVGRTFGIAFSGDYAYAPALSNKHYILSTGIKREVILDIGGLQKNADYRKAPPDVYIGSGSSISGQLTSWCCDSSNIIMNYRNMITINKNPYFESVTLPTVDNVFDVKKVSNRLKGNLTIPYVMNGQFTPYNTIKLEVTSINSFKLKNAGNNEIPYSLSTTLGVRKLNIADKGTVVNPQSIIIFTDLSKEFYALQGRFDADFSVDSSINTGDYTDTVTAVYTLSL